MSKEEYINRLQKFIENGDTHIIAVSRLKEFIDEMKISAPKDKDYPCDWTAEWEEWFHKWFGEVP